MADYMHFSLRLNRDIPEHKRIIKFLDEMDPGKYKSKTAFLASAISFYIACIEDGSLEKLEDRKFREHATDYVTRDEFNARFEGLSDSIEKKIYREIISAYIKTPISASAVEPENQKDASGYGADDTTLEKDLEQYAGVMDSIMSWSSDDS